MIRWDGEKFSVGGGLKVSERFGEAGFLQIVAKLWIEMVFVFLMPCRDGLGNFAQGIEMACRITVAPSVIGDDGFAALEQIDEQLVHVW